MLVSIAVFFQFDGLYMVESCPRCSTFLSFPAFSQHLFVIERLGPRAVQSEKMHSIANEAFTS